MRVLIVETYPRGVGEDWAVDSVYPTLLLDTDRDDAPKLLSWVKSHTIIPPSLRLNFGRMNITHVSMGEDLHAYVLFEGHLKVPGALDRPVLSDPGGPRALVEAFERAGSG